MVTRIIRTPSEIEGLARLLGSRQLPLTVTITTGEDRSGQQNALSHKWYAEAAQQLSDRTASDVRAHCKLWHGVKMLHAENEAFRLSWNRLIKDRFTIEEKLELMVPPHDYPVTRLMTVKQMTRYMDECHRDLTSLGVVLTDPESQRYA